LKILFLSIEYPPETGGGGIGSYVASIAPALASRGHEVHVLSCASGQAYRDYLEEGVHIHRRVTLQIPGLGLLSRALRLSRAVGRFQNGLSTFLEYRRLGIDFDVIEHPDWSAEGWFFALLHNRPLVAHLHTPLPVILKHNQLPVTFDARIASTLEHFSVKRSDVITSPSRLLVKTLNDIGWLKGKDVEIIPYPIDCSRWENIPPPSKAPPIVLFIGRLEQLKAPEFLAQAITIIRKEIPEAKAMFVGMSKGKRHGTPYVEWIRKFVRDDHGCQFVGYVPRTELSRFFSECRVLAIPSWHDNFPMVALESMAAGRAVVATQNTGVAELLEITQAGKIIPAGDPNALADALRPFLIDPNYAVKIGERARNTAFKMLDPVKLADKRIKAYQKAIEAFHARLHIQASCFHHALPEQVASFEIPKTWRNWAVSESIKTPWKHFYLTTSRQFLELLAKEKSYEKRAELRGISILDIGCTPAISALLASLGANVTMLDIDPSELYKGKQHAVLLGLTENTRYVCADAFKIPFRAATFDIVWNSGFLEHFENPKQILQQMGRVLRPGGVLTVLVPNRWTPHSLWIRNRLRARPSGYGWDKMGRERSYTQDQLIRLLRDAGFQVIASSTSNIRRSILDDSVVLRHLNYLTIRGLLFRLMNAIDWIENYIPFFKNFGFMVGAIAIAPLRNKK